MPNRFTSKNKTIGNNRLTRRQFVATAGAAVVAPAIVPSSVLGANAPSNGTEFVCRTQDPGFGARFEGTEGWVQFTVNNMNEVEASSDAIKHSVIGPDEIHLPISDVQANQMLRRPYREPWQI